MSLSPAPPNAEDAARAPSLLDQLSVLMADARALSAADDAEAPNVAAQALALAEEIGSPDLRGAAAESLARCQMQRGHYAEALIHARSALALHQQADGPRAQARAHCLIADLWDKLGHSESALESAQSALALARSSEDPQALAWACSSLAFAYKSLDDHAEARNFLLQAQEYSLASDDRPLLARTLNSLGNTHIDTGVRLGDGGDEAGHQAEAVQALALYRRAAELFRSLGEARGHGVAMANIALCHAVLREFESADRILGELLIEARASGNRSIEEMALRGLGGSLTHQHRNAEAIDAYQQALAIAEEIGFLYGQVDSHRTIAKAYEQLGDFESALRHFRRFHEIERRIINEVNALRARAIAVRIQTERARAETEAAQRKARQLESSNRDLLRETERLSAERFADPLTGLFNRRRLDLAVRTELAERGPESPFSVALIDIDYFKRVNDTFSHQVGDDVLREVGAILRHACRQGDFAVRYGGEEFALVFLQAPIAEARAACERVRAAIEDHDWSALHAELRISVSIGAADNAEAPGTEAVFSLADRRLYAAKQAGRNRIVCEG